MEIKIMGGMIVILIVALGIFYFMYSSVATENVTLKTALASQSAMLAETQKELQLRDTVIKQRDAELAELERKAEQQVTKYARLVRTKKAVQDWDAVALPDDVNGLLRAAGANSEAVSSGDADNGGGHP